MQLYGSLTSPYVRKVRVLLAEKNLPYDMIVSDVWAPDSPIPALNPLGKVPTLIGDDGQIWFDSGFLVEYIDAQRPPHLIPSSGFSRWEVLRWHALAQGLLDITVTRLLEGRRSEIQRSALVLERQESKIAATLRYAEAALGPAGRSWLVSDSLSLADISLAVALAYIDFRYPHDWRASHPLLADWLTPILARPSFTSTAPPP